MHNYLHEDIKGRITQDAFKLLHLRIHAKYLFLMILPMFCKCVLPSHAPFYNNIFNVFMKSVIKPNNKY